MSERLNVFKEQTVHMRLLFAGVQEARMKHNDAWCSVNLLLVSSACDETGALGC